MTSLTRVFLDIGRCIIRFLLAFRGWRRLALLCLFDVSANGVDVDTPCFFSIDLMVMLDWEMSRDLDFQGLFLAPTRSHPVQRRHRHHRPVTAVVAVVTNAAVFFGRSGISGGFVGVLLTFESVPSLSLRVLTRLS
jgi:hypothetical protein